MTKIDYKLSNKELYAPKEEPSVIQVPSMNFLMVNGYGDPNDADGEYNKAVELLYALSYTLKMSRKKLPNASELIDYVVPPLEGLWWLDDDTDRDFTQKSKFRWISMIRVPEFITREEFIRAQNAVKQKKPSMDPGLASLEVFEEGLCVQCMHKGPYDLESATIAKIDTYIKNNGYYYDMGTQLPDGKIRHHHEIYLSDPRKANPATMKTILRHPIKMHE